VYILYGLGDVDLPGGGDIWHFDGEEGDMTGEFIDEFEGFLDIGLVGFHSNNVL
jgi:hypothetical protein